MKDSNSALLMKLREEGSPGEERFDSALERVEEIMRKIAPYVEPLRLRRPTPGKWQPEPDRMIGRPGKKR